MDPRRVLIVANQTAGGTHLMEAVRARLGSGPCRFMLLVPATPPPDHATWTEGEARALAQERMESALESLRGIGAEIEGVVGDHRPVNAIADLLIERPQDEVIVSTLPIGVSRWLKQDLPHKIEKAFGLPVTHVVAEPARKH